ncbi:MAG TPA: Gfo/Idh/MocA family oxidoreductase [Terriglobia bacterium]|nr:Gfo/Idh/MocA family oxidoreductase [Terriglobia bacterium]
MTPKLRIGLIGAGFIARCHAYAYRVLPMVFPEAPAHPEMTLVCDQTQALAEAAAERFGFARATDDWRRLVADPEIDIVDICVPSNLHKPIALAAIAAGKHVYCEKPVGLGVAEAQEIADAAARAGRRSLVGFTYLRHPILGLARRLIDDGAIGAVTHFRGQHNEDYLCDPQSPFTWRCDPAIGGAAGALGDLGAHIISLARALCGEIVEVNASRRTMIKQRPTTPGGTEMRDVGNDDITQMMVRFASGAGGYLEASRIATGSKMNIGFEITGTEGALRFDGERINELQVFDRRAGLAQAGFRTILANPDHPPYGNFIPAPGHGLGFNDLKVIEVKELMDAVMTGRSAGPDLAEAARISAVMEAAIRGSARNGSEGGGWLAV